MTPSPAPGEDLEPLHRSADEILSLELPQAFRGYRLRDVDALLGELALQIAAMQSELEAARTGGVPWTGAADAGATDAGAASTTPTSGGAATPGTESLGTGTRPRAVLGPDGSGPDTAPVDDLPPREALGVTAGARRRALVPSLALTLAAALVLARGWSGEDRTTTLVAIGLSLLALVGVGFAVWRTRGRSRDPGAADGAEDDAVSDLGADAAPGAASPPTADG